MIALVAAGMLVVLAGLATIGTLVLNQGSGPVASSLATTVSPEPTTSSRAGASSPTSRPSAKPATPAPTKRPAVAPVRKLTATLGGQYCPVASINQNACWHGTLVNTGPRIGKLAFIFVIGGGYTNWFATHSSPALSGFYTTPGCVLDIPRSRMLCGAVPTGGHVSVYLSADTSKVGAFHYGVKFADISGGTTLYVDENRDGTHQIVSWSEVIA